MKKHKDSISHLLFLFVLFNCFVLTIPASAQNKADQIDALLQKYYDYGEFNGTALIAEDGKVILKKGYGYADMEWQIANTPDTRFRLGSITKQFTAMLVMQLVEQGKLALDGSICDYLPDYPKDPGEKITLHHLLTHTSGIPGFTEFPTYRAVSRNPISPEAFIRTFADSSLFFEPGTKYRYSNSGYFLLGVIIEKVTGKPYEQMLQEYILTPLKMKNTGYDHHNTILAKRAAGYEKRLDGFINADYLDMSIPYAAGALYSTVEDLYLWDQGLYTDKLLPSSLKERMFTPFLNGYAYGWGVRKAATAGTKDSVLSVSHGGGINGFSTLISRYPEDKNLVVLFNNTGGAPLGEMNEKILAILKDKPFTMPKKSVVPELYSLLSEVGIEAAVKRYHDALQKQSDLYKTNENEMNALGYALLQRGKNEQAIAVFKLNVESFPHSSNVYDSLGEAYMINGDTELAIKNYEKSVELNPNNAGGIEMLKELTK